MFYCFPQSNSGGYYMKDDNVAEFVIIEANTLEQLEGISDKIFDNYLDFCPCCGPRWWYADEVDGYREPRVYGTPVNEYFAGKYADSSATIIIYYLDGHKEIHKKEGRVG